MDIIVTFEVSRWERRLGVRVATVGRRLWHLTRLIPGCFGGIGAGQLAAGD